MTEFFSNFGKKISNVGQETVKRTKEIAEISRKEIFYTIC